MLDTAGGGVHLLEAPDRALTTTPWGAAEKLRERKLTPGLRWPRAAVDRSQRERIHGATVAAVSEHGYRAVCVADILSLAAVSRSTFYRHFDNKLECFLATLDALAEVSAPLLERAYESGSSPRARLLAVLEAIAALAVAQPAAARVWLIEAYAAGPHAVARVERGIDDLLRVVDPALDGLWGSEQSPPPARRALVAGIGRIVRARLADGREDELPGLATNLLDWALGYSAPPVALRAPCRPPALPRFPLETDRQRRLILAAVTELVVETGYPAITTTTVKRRAGISLTTFYKHFGDKADAFVAALDDLCRQLEETVLSAYRSAPDWPRAVRNAVHAHFAFHAAHPALARLEEMLVFPGDRHDVATARFGSLLASGTHRRPDLGPIVGEAVASAVSALLHAEIRRRGPERLYEAAGTATFLALAPFVGAREACELANEGWHAAPRPDRPSPGS